MLALTIRNPWADAIARGLKPVENRKWQPWKKALGQDIAIHASRQPHLKRMGDYEALVREVHGQPRRLEDMPSGFIVAVVRLVGAVQLITGQVVGDLSPEQVERVQDSCWAEGPWAWHLDRIRALPEPIFCRGSQGLWAVPDDVLSRITGG